MLEEYMQNIGYSKEQIDMIEASYPLRSYTESTLLYCLKNLVNYLRRNTFDNNDIIYITTVLPQLISMSIEDIKIKVDELLNHGISKINVYHIIKEYPYIIDMSNQRISNKYQILDELGFSNQAINSIIINQPSILNIDPSFLKNRYLFFKDYGYKQNEIHTIIEAIPELFLITTNKLQKKLDEYSSFGLKKDEIIKLTYYLPELFIFVKEELREKTFFMEEYGYPIEDIISIIKRVPIILKSSYISQLQTKWNVLEGLGFTSSEVVQITKENPYILLYCSDFIKENFDNFVQNNFYHKEVLEMILKTPLLLSYSKETMSHKLKYYKKFLLFDYIKENPHVLLYNIDIIKKREKYIKDKEYVDLFLNDSLFKKKYKVSREKLLGE